MRYCQTHLASVLVLKLQLQCLLDLVVLKLNGGVLSITISVIFGKHSKSLVVLVLGYEVTRRLGNPVDEGELDQGWQALEDAWDTPAPLIGDVVRAK